MGAPQFISRPDTNKSSLPDKQWFRPDYRLEVPGNSLPRDPNDFTATDYYLSRLYYRYCRSHHHLSRMSCCLSGESHQKDVEYLSLCSAHHRS